MHALVGDARVVVLDHGPRCAGGRDVSKVRARGVCGHAASLSGSCSAPCGASSTSVAAAELAFGMSVGLLFVVRRSQGKQVDETLERERYLAPGPPRPMPGAILFVLAVVVMDKQAWLAISRTVKHCDDPMLSNSTHVACCWGSWGSESVDLDSDANGGGGQVAGVKR